MDPVFPRGALLTILDDLADTGAFLDTAVVKLFQNNITPTPNSLITDFTICNFSGYSDSAAIVWGNSYIRPDGTAVVPGGSVEFRQTGVTVTNIAYGFCVVHPGGGTPYLIMSARFDTPVNFTAIGRGVVVTPEFSLPQQTP